MKINFIYSENKEEIKLFIEDIKINIKNCLNIKNIKYIENDFSKDKKHDIYIIFLDDDKLIDIVKNLDSKDNSIIITFSIKVEFVKKIIQYSNKLFYITANKNQILYEILNKCEEIDKKKETKKSVKTAKKV